MLTRPVRQASDKNKYPSTLVWGKLWSFFKFGFPMPGLHHNNFFKALDEGEIMVFFIIWVPQQRIYKRGDPEHLTLGPPGLGRAEPIL